MKKLLIALGIFGLIGIAHAVSVFNSSQVGSNPVNGNILQTNGSVSTWVPNSPSTTIPTTLVKSINGVSGTITSSTPSTDLPFLDTNNIFAGTNAFSKDGQGVSVGTGVNNSSSIGFENRASVGYSNSTSTGDVGYSYLASIGGKGVALCANGTTSTNCGLYVTSSSLVYTPNLDSIFYLPPPALLAFGWPCGGNIDTDVGQCINDVYAAGSLVGDSTGIIIGPFAYSYSIPINFNQRAKLVYMAGQGSGSALTYTSTTVPTAQGAITLNDCNSNNKREATQLYNFALYGTTATSTNGGVTLLYAGGTNGACETHVDSLTLRTANRGLVVASNTYLFSFDNSLVANIGTRSLLQMNGANANLGENLEYGHDLWGDPALVSVGGIASGSNQIYLDNNSSPSTIFNDNSFDGIFGQINADNYSVVFNGGQDEDTGAAFSGTADRWVVAPSTLGTHVIWDNGFDFTEDATSSNGNPLTELVQCGANCEWDNITVARNGNATATTKFASFTAGGTGSGVFTFCNVIPINVPYGQLAGFSGNINNNGCLYSYHNSYVMGWDYTGTNQASFDGTANTAPVTISGNISGNGGINSVYIGSASNNIHPIGSSTLDLSGTLGLKGFFDNGSTTIAGQESASANSNGFTVYVTNGSTNTTDTLPSAATAPNRMYIFKNRGTGQKAIAVTSTDSFSACGSAATTSGSILLQTNSSTALYDEYGLSGLPIWDVLCNL